MTFGSLFSGIGGIDLGLCRAGLECRWQCEIDPYAQAVLEKHWPEVPKYRDVRYFLGSKRWRKARDAWSVDCIAGGFPCQDISNAGRRAGIDGERSGLWREFARIVHLLRPRFVFVENVPALTIRGLERVLGDLAALGYDAEWDCIPAAAVGAPHSRWRLFLLAHRQRDPLDVCAVGVAANRDEHEDGPSTRQEKRTTCARRGTAPNANSPRKLEQEGVKSGFGRRAGDISKENAPDANRSGFQGTHQIRARKSHTFIAHESVTFDAASGWARQRWRQQFAAFCQEQGRLLWPNAIAPVCGVADGISHRVERLRGLGNAVLPQIAEWYGRQMLRMGGLTQ